MEPAADLRILALDILAHHLEVDLLGRAAGQRAGDALEQPDRAQVDILVHGAADGDQQPPQRDVVGHAGPAHGAQEDGVEGPQPLQPVVGHHGPGPGVALAGPVEGLPPEGKAVPASRRLDGPQALGHRLPADPVAGNHGDAIAAQPARSLSPPQLAPRLPLAPPERRKDCPSPGPTRPACFTRRPCAPSGRSGWRRLTPENRLKAESVASRVGQRAHSACSATMSSKYA